MKNTTKIILAIESSCDDTSCAVLANTKVLSNVTANQLIHKKYGGVVPELASRDHQKNIVPVVNEALTLAEVKLNELTAISVTKGPGLMGSLLVGISFAKSLALALSIPLIGVNHMQGHILAHFIDDANKTGAPHFPFICLTVSGGHTQLVLVKNYLDFEIIGETQDDAVGEAFDKAAKIIGLEYPGGPLIDKFARDGDFTKYKFAESKLEGLNYSFSGIKTSFLYFINKEVQKNENFINENLNDICASYQKHLVTVLLKNAEIAIKKYGIKYFAIAGGVSANSELRLQVKHLCERLNVNYYIPKFEYCTDNAAMIGITAYYKLLENKLSDFNLTPQVRLSVTEF